MLYITLSWMMATDKCCWKSNMLVPLADSCASEMLSCTGGRYQIHLRNYSRFTQAATDTILFRLKFSLWYMKLNCKFELIRISFGCFKLTCQFIFTYRSVMYAWLKEFLRFVCLISLMITFYSLWYIKLLFLIWLC